MKFRYCMKIPCQVELRQTYQERKNSVLEEMEEIHVTDTISKARKIKDTILKLMMVLSAGLICSLLLGLIGYILYRGIPHISWMLVSTKPSLLRGTVGILPNILNTLYIIIITLVIVLPLGVGAAIYLNEYAKNKKLVRVIELDNRNPCRNPINYIWTGGNAPVCAVFLSGNQSDGRFAHPGNHDIAHDYTHHTGKPENGAKSIPGRFAWIRGRQMVYDSYSCHSLCH